MVFKRSVITVLAWSAFYMAAAQSYSGVHALIERRVPWLSGHIVLDSIAGHNGKELAVLSMQKNKIKIAASSASAASKGVYYYLTQYCHRSMSHLGDNLSAVKKLPVVNKPDTLQPAFPIRYALNYCTISYSMAFYNWQDWEHELDWMAFNGVNLMLAPMGMEAVWQKVLRQYGLSDTEIQQFLPGPAFTAWWLMDNLEGWGGPVSNAFIERQKKLQQQILSRMRTLGIQPLLQSFYGMVPTALKEKYPGWNIIPQGNWAGDFKRPDILLPTDPHFSGMAKVYYDAIKELYGDDIHYFGGEPFHEGGNASGVDVPACAAAIQQTMLENMPNSTWVLMGWQVNPSDQLLAKLNKKHVLVQELFGENTDNWYKRKAYNGTPFLWCTVTNFGEKSGLYGKLQRISGEVYRAQTSEYASYMQGVGIMPEGIGNNPVVYDLLMDLAWKNKKISIEDWVQDYVQYRYGSNSDNLQKAWKIFAQTVYSSYEQLHEGPPESVFCARPSLEINSASSWGTRRRYYDTGLFKNGVRLFMQYSNRAYNEPYETDKIDFVRQVLSNKGEIWYANMIKAYTQKDSTAFKEAAGIFLNGILQQDSLLSCSKFFRLNRWLNSAYSCMDDEYDKKLFLRNAKQQITIWGPDNNPRTNLHDYANKEWNGLMRYFYYPRWQLFINDCLKTLRGEHFTPTDFYDLEVRWTKLENRYPAISLSIQEQNDLVRRVLE